jgi:hypothetical protein
MASSGSFNTSSYEGRNLKFSWSIAKQDIENNATTINWTLEGDGKGKVDWYLTQNIKLVIDGSVVFSTGYDPQITLRDGTIVATGQKVIYHNADGSRTFTASAEAGIYVWAVNCTGSGTFTIDTIPRASTFTVSNASPNMGTAVTFTITRASTAFTHKLTLTWGGVTSNIATGVSTSQSWTIPLSLANDLPNSTSSGCYITCITYNGSTEIGRKTLSMTLNVPTSVVPSISSVTISEAVSGLATKFGAYVQNKSKLKVVTAASGSYKSTIKTYSVTILNRTYTGGTITSDIITSSGSVSIAVTVTDTRGRTASTTKTVTVSAYSDPKITAFSAQRCNSDGTLNDEGEYVKIEYAFSVTSLNSKNDKTYTIAYKLKDASDYTTLKTDNVYSANTTLIPTTVFSGDNSYDFKITVADYFKSIFQGADVSTAFTLMDFNSSGTGIALGKVAETENLLDIALDAQFRGNTFAFQPSAFNGEKGYTLLATITLTALNVNAPIVFVINRRGVNSPMRVYVRFASSSASLDPALDSITYEGDNFGAFLVKKATSIWSLYVDNTGGWSNPCLQEWYTTDNQNSRLSVTFPSEQIATLPTPWYRATPTVSRSILDCFFSVGSIIIRYDHADPNTMFPGTTWVRITNRFLWACDADGDIGIIGGEKTHTLTVNELPKHSHGAVYSGVAEGTKNTAWLASGGDKMAYGALYTGGDAAHNNMPPYIQVSIWRRTA